jgi:hypothetical protein
VPKGSAKLPVLELSEQVASSAGCAVFANQEWFAGLPLRRKSKSRPQQQELFLLKSFGFPRESSNYRREIWSRSKTREMLSLITTKVLMTDAFS